MGREAVAFFYVMFFFMFIFFLCELYVNLYNCWVSQNFTVVHIYLLFVYFCFFFIFFLRNTNSAKGWPMLCIVQGSIPCIVIYLCLLFIKYYTQLNTQLKCTKFYCIFQVLLIFHILLLENTFYCKVPNSIGRCLILL